MSQATPAQRQAIQARGNVLVMAGAGAGKTSTLVERCLAWLMSPEERGSLEEILMVTFTEAAAAEMRKRIRKGLEKKLDEAAENQQMPELERLEEQLALLETAHIGTLHSFCLQLIRQHFHELELDPQVTVLAEEETRLLENEVLEELLTEHYADKHGNSAAIRELIQVQGQGKDVEIRKLILKLHHYTQSLPRPDKWLKAQADLFENPLPEQWQRWLQEGVLTWASVWLPVLQSHPPEAANVLECAVILQEILNQPAAEKIGTALVRLQACDADERWPKKKKTFYRKPIASFFSEVEFLASLLPPDGDIKPLAEDWNWSRHQMLALIDLAQEFAERFASAKRELGTVDFPDLEQFALRLLVAPDGSSTATARIWRQKFRLVFVDEYQDINAAQDAILRAVSREGAEANRFLVGDVKQSIYRFRLADPKVFQDYAHEWRSGAAGQVIPLSDNFRSHEAILNFVNPLFDALLRAEVGGVDYPEEAWLCFGNPEGRKALSVAMDESPRVEVHLRLNQKGNVSDEDATEEGAGKPGLDRDDMSSSEKEARLVAQRLMELQSKPTPVWDEEHKKFRPAEWRDMVVLLRAPGSKVEAYAKEFARANVPLTVKRSGFYEQTEVTDWLNLLTLLDNPLQDIPLLAVLRSPLVGLTLDELAMVRLTQRKGRLWTTLTRFHHTQSETAQRFPELAAAAHAKVALFLQQFSRWRRLVRRASLSQSLELMFKETSYAEWLMTQPRGEQRRANVERLLEMLRQFDRFQRQGLLRFLRFIESQQETEISPEMPATEAANAVRLMSVHQSKGLEFPIVVFADLGKRFNQDDQRGTLMLDEYYGLCPQVQPPNQRQRYPSAVFWLAKQRQRREALGEELRLLYVALTRARDHLLLVGTISRNAAENDWSSNAPSRPATREVLRANTFLHWLGLWLPPFTGHTDWVSPGKHTRGQLTWTIHEDATLTPETSVAMNEPVVTEPKAPVSERELVALRERIEWHYPFPEPTSEPAKTSVSALRQRHTAEDDEARHWFRVPAAKDRATKTELNAAEIGTAHHQFLQYLNLTVPLSEAALREQAQEMIAALQLSAEQVGVLDFATLAQFWRSEIGQRIQAHATQVHRELPFTARLTVADLRDLHLPTPLPAGSPEFLVIQGTVDLAVILPEEIWLLDFKTDHVRPRDLNERVAMYEPQLRLYALALQRIYARPVTVAWLHFLQAQKSVTVAI